MCMQFKTNYHKPKISNLNLKITNRKSQLMQVWIRDSYSFFFNKFDLIHHTIIQAQSVSRKLATTRHLPERCHKTLLGWNPRHSPCKLATVPWRGRLFNTCTYCAILDLCTNQMCIYFISTHMCTYEISLLQRRWSSDITHLKKKSEFCVADGIRIFE